MVMTTIATETNDSRGGSYMRLKKSSENMIRDYLFDQGFNVNSIQYGPLINRNKQIVVIEHTGGFCEGHLDTVWGQIILQDRDGILGVVEHYSDVAMMKNYQEKYVVTAEDYEEVNQPKYKG